MASALTPTTSCGRPGRWTSPAEIIVVTPPFRKLSIQPSWLWRGVQSPNTGWTWLSIRPGASACPWRRSRRRAWRRIDVLGLADRGDAAVDCHDGVGVEDGRSRSPESSRPMLRITSLPCWISGACRQRHMIARLVSGKCSEAGPASSSCRDRPPARHGRNRAARVASSGRQRRRSSGASQFDPAGTAAAGARPRRGQAWLGSGSRAADPLVTALNACDGAGPA